MRSPTVYVTVIALCWLADSVLGVCTVKHGSATLHCDCGGNDDFASADVPQNISIIEKFILSNCNLVALPHRMLNDSKITRIEIDTVAHLNLNDKLPSDLDKLHISNVGKLDGLAVETFKEITYLTQLMIENATISFVEPMSLSELNLVKVVFTNVTFERLMKNSLKMYFNDQQKSELSIIDCSFRMIEGEDPIIKANAKKKTFSNNSLNCNPLVLDYQWISELFEKEIKKNKTVVCRYLEDNYCSEDKTPENKIISQWNVLKRNGTISVKTGLQLDKLCIDPINVSQPTGESVRSNGRYSTMVNHIMLWVLASLLTVSMVSCKWNIE